MENWLKYRLTPAKQKLARWHELASTVEKLWEFYFDPLVDRTQRLRSSYTADAADLIRKIRECGDYFCLEIPPSEVNRPVQYAWRRLELQYKEIEDIINAALRRHFGDFAAFWYPLFAGKEKQYGTDFLVPDDFYKHTDWQKNVPPEGYFLTSRGILAVNRNSLYKYNYDKFLFMADAKPIIQRTKPLHNVFENFLWFIESDLGVFDPSFDVTWEVINQIDLLFQLYSTRFDYINADVRRLDTDVFTITSESQRFSKIFFIHPWQFWRLDRFMPEGLEWFPLEYRLPYYETSLKSFFAHEPVCWAYNEYEREIGLDFRDIIRTTFASAISRLSSVIFDSKYDFDSEIDRYSDIQFEHDYLFVRETFQVIDHILKIFVYDICKHKKDKMAFLAIDCILDFLAKEHYIYPKVEFNIAPITTFSTLDRQYRLEPKLNLALYNFSQNFASLILPYLEYEAKKEVAHQVKLDFDEPPLNCAISLRTNAEIIEHPRLDVNLSQETTRVDSTCLGEFDLEHKKQKDLEIDVEFLDSPIGSWLKCLIQKLDIDLEDLKLELNNTAHNLFSVAIECFKLDANKEHKDHVSLTFLDTPISNFPAREKRLVFEVPKFDLELLENYN